MIAMPAVVAELVVPLSYGTLRERGSKLRAGYRREVRATHDLRYIYLT
ncbi:hypothetical protein [Nostoc sp. LEGE 12450]|nr:hypothetical protein [Nostoc sp. LEGE 12450]MBE8990318.1 hypothetical protein [Nostoc sp. LEGE 12450]